MPPNPPVLHAYMHITYPGNHPSENPGYSPVTTPQDASHCKSRLVVLTAEWLPWLHGLLW